MVNRGWSRGIGFWVAIAVLGVGCGGDVVGSTSSTHPRHDASLDAPWTVTSRGGASAMGTGGRYDNADVLVFGTGGSSSTTEGAPCQCPSDGFFVEVRGDGNPVVLSFGGARPPLACEAGTTPNTPTGAATKACGIIGVSELSACKGPNHAPPCLDVRLNGSGFGTYVDATGLSWNIDTFDFREGDAGSPGNGTFRGDYDAMVRQSDGGLPVAISGNVYVCGWLISVLRPCR